MAMGTEVCCSSRLLRYFSALSKGEPLPVKERIELPLATEKTEAGLTPGLLKILHKQVQTGLYQMYNAVEECWCVGDGWGDCQVFDLFWGGTVFLVSFLFSEFLLRYRDFV